MLEVAYHQQNSDFWASCTFLVWITSDIIAQILGCAAFLCLVYRDIIPQASHQKLMKNSKESWALK